MCIRDRVLMPAAGAARARVLCDTAGVVECAEECWAPQRALVYDQLVAVAVKVEDSNGLFSKECGDTLVCHPSSVAEIDWPSPRGLRSTMANSLLAPCKPTTMQSPAVSGATGGGDGGDGRKYGGGGGTGTGDGDGGGGEGGWHTGVTSEHATGQEKTRSAIRSGELTSPPPCLQW
eukprot:3010606-Prymnesium_polylepis.2